MIKEYLTMEKSSMPEGPHMTQEDIDEYAARLYPGKVITARYIFNLEETAGHIHPALNLGRVKPGAILNHHEFRVRKVYPHQVELETFDRGEKWICYVPLKTLYMNRENTLIYSIRKAAA